MNRFRLGRGAFLRAPAQAVLWVCLLNGVNGVNGVVVAQAGPPGDICVEPDPACESLRIEEPEEAAAAPQSVRASLGNFRETRSQRLYLDVFSGPLYSTRFSNSILDAVARLHWRPKAGGPVSLYLNGHVTRDSRSRGGSLPVVFSDNVGLVGAGISVQPQGWNVTLLAEANVAFNLTRTAAHSRDTEPDYRVMLYYYRRSESRWYGPIGALTFGQLRGERLFTDYDASLGYYSRYDHNRIAYLQVREGMRLADWGASRLLGYAKLFMAKDANRDFFNNVGEVGTGLEWRPHREVNLGLRMEYLRGYYYGIAGRDPNPYGSRYDDFRVMLLFGRRF